MAKHVSCQMTKLTGIRRFSGQCEYKIGIHKLNLLIYMYSVALNDDAHVISARATNWMERRKYCWLMLEWKYWENMREIEAIR